MVPKCIKEQASKIGRHGSIVTVPSGFGFPIVLFLTSQNSRASAWFGHVNFCSAPFLLSFSQVVLSTDLPDQAMYEFINMSDQLHELLGTPFCDVAACFVASGLRGHASWPLLPRIHPCCTQFLPSLHICNLVRSAAKAYLTRQQSSSAFSCFNLSTNSNRPGQPTVCRQLTVSQPTVQLANQPFACRPTI